MSAEPEIDWPERPVHDVEYVAVRVEGCACGGLISAHPDSQLPIISAVRAHQATPRHEEWRRLGGLEFDPELMGRAVS